MTSRQNGIDQYFLDSHPHSFSVSAVPLQGTIDALHTQTWCWQSGIMYHFFDTRLRAIRRDAEYC